MELHGWPLAKLKNPGNVTSLGDLERVLKALKDGMCGWVRLRNDKLEERQKELEEQVRHRMCAPLKWAGTVSDASAEKKRKRSGGGMHGLHSKRAKVGRKGRLGSIIDDEDNIEGDENVRNGLVLGKFSPRLIGTLSGLDQTSQSRSKSGIFPKTPDCLVSSLGIPILPETISDPVWTGTA